MKTLTCLLLISIIGFFSCKNGNKLDGTKTDSQLNMISTRSEKYANRIYMDSEAEYEASNGFLDLNPSIDDKQVVVNTLFLLEYLMDNDFIDTTIENNDGIEKIKEYKMKKADSYDIFITDCFQISSEYLTKEGNEFMEKCIGNGAICSYQKMFYDNLKDFEILDNCKLEDWFQNLYLIKYNEKNRKRAFELFDDIRNH